MDEPVALVIAIPAVALTLWSLAWFGGLVNSQARTVVAAERSAAAATASLGTEATATATAIATGDTWPACTAVTAGIAHIDIGSDAAVSLVCDVPGPVPNSQVCVTGFAQTRPARTGHVHVACPGP